MIIRELLLYTNDIAATRDCYAGKMRLEINEESAFHISFIAGNSLLEFRYSEEADPFYHIAFGIPNNKLNEAIAWVKCFTSLLPYSANEQIADFSTWNAKAFYFHDNNNNILELITHYDLHLESAKQFSAASITGICEVGIVTDDVVAATKMIFTKYHIPYFSKGPNLPDFSVMGNAHGMFIISKKRRGWLPTQRPSEYHPLEVMIEEAGKSYHICF